MIGAQPATARGRVAECLARIAAAEPRVRAFAWLRFDRARRLARDADGGAGADPYGLRGMPVAVKDIFDTAGVPTECGTPLLAGRVPERSADAVLALEAAGAIVLGKTVTAELAFYAPGPTRNPRDPERTPGGSSMGSAAAVAAGMAPLAVGSQTNGSVIRPAAFCGVVGLKPTRGRIPLGGVLAFAPTLDTAGAFARTVEEVARLGAAMAGDPLAEWWSGRTPAAPRLAIARTRDWPRAEPAMRERFDADMRALREAGADVSEPPLPEGLEDAVPVLRTIMAVEGARSLGPIVARRPEDASEVIRRLLDEGARTPDARYRDALRERDRLAAAFGEWAFAFDAILTPPALGEAPSRETTGDPIFCSRWTLVGAPAVVVPTGVGPHGLPLGLQFVGAPGADRRTLETAAWAAERLGQPGGAP